MISNMDLPFGILPTMTSSDLSGFPSNDLSSLDSSMLNSHQPKANRPVPEFLYHLTRMLRDTDNHHLIEWANGRIIVHNPTRLENEVLGNYYRHSKFSSFQRQLNYFGFTKHSGKRKMSPCSYTNENLTTELESIIKLKRKQVKKAKRLSTGGSLVTPITTTHSQTPSLVPSLVHQVSYNSTTSGEYSPKSESDSESNFTEPNQPWLSQAVPFHKSVSMPVNLHPTTKASQKSVDFCGQPFIVSAEEYKAPGDCDALRGYAQTKPLHVANPFSLPSQSQHQKSSNSLSQAQELVNQISALPVPSLFSFVKNEGESMANPGEDETSTEDDIATFLALESAFCSDFNDNSSSRRSSDHDTYFSEETDSADSWLPEPLQVKSLQHL